MLGELVHQCPESFVLQLLWCHKALQSSEDHQHDGCEELQMAMHLIHDSYQCQLLLKPAGTKSQKLFCLGLISMEGALWVKLGMDSIGGETGSAEQVKTFGHFI